MADALSHTPPSGFDVLLLQESPGLEGLEMAQWTVMASPLDYQIPCNPKSYAVVAVRQKPGWVVYQVAPSALGYLSAEGLLAPRFEHDMQRGDTCGANGLRLGDPSGFGEAENKNPRREQSGLGAVQEKEGSLEQPGTKWPSAQTVVYLRVVQTLNVSI